MSSNIQPKSANEIVTKAFPAANPESKNKRHKQDGHPERKRNRAEKFAPSCSL
jgi:hypothetical protein